MQQIVGTPPPVSLAGASLPHSRLQQASQRCDCLRWKTAVSTHKGDLASLGRSVWQQTSTRGLRVGVSGRVVTRNALRAHTTVTSMVKSPRRTRLDDVDRLEGSAARRMSTRVLALCSDTAYLVRSCCGSARTSTGHGRDTNYNHTASAHTDATHRPRPASNNSRSCACPSSTAGSTPSPERLLLSSLSSLLLSSSDVGGFHKLPLEAPPRPPPRPRPTPPKPRPVDGPRATEACEPLEDATPLASRPAARSFPPRHLSRNCSLVLPMCNVRRGAAGSEVGGKNQGPRHLCFLMRP